MRLQGVVERLQGSLEEQQQENTELISKITSQAAELSSLQTSHDDLQSRLNMAELLTQQVGTRSLTHMLTCMITHTHTQQTT